MKTALGAVRLRWIFATTLSVLLGLMLSFVTQPSFAKAKETNKKKASVSSQSSKKLSTNVDFDDRVVGGQYPFSTEAITKVEDDKSLDDLIGVRKNFKDRIEQSKALR